ncbi:dnaJ homolog subfamily C member 30, mitochondrial-like isoform X1 [Hoplias malabaricus]|uniref:dnaJ homolog subfamily C member 30, mitochondrial-like isoform X1 n=1 Tax=Hoplias malabaricus TaxID=27720 RepID=UPI003462755C
MYRVACCVNRSVLLAPCSSRIQKAECFGSYCTVLLLTGRQSQPRPWVILTQTCNWSSNQSYDVSLHMSKTAYYDILEVSPTATQTQIKTAYYKQSFLYHPDKNAGSEEATKRFAQISEAYSVLGSVGLRKKYDRGILSSADVQAAGRPSGKQSSATSPSTGQQHSGKKSTRPVSSATVGGKPVFDFDAFYQAHYGEQLQREQALRRWRKQYERKQEREFSTWKLDRMMGMVVGLLLAAGYVVVGSFKT